MQEVDAEKIQTRYRTAPQLTQHGPKEKQAMSTKVDNIETFGPSITMMPGPLSPLLHTCSPATQTTIQFEKCGTGIIFQETKAH